MNDVISRSKELFADKLPQELLDEVATWSDYHQNFFWAYVYRRFVQIRERRMLDEIMYGGATRLPVGIANLRQEDVSPTPFKDAEKSLAPGRWFSKSHVV